MNSLSPELLELFVSEASVHLEALKKECLSEKPDLQILYRIFHAIKGSAAVMGLTAIQEEAAYYENLAQTIRDRGEEEFSILPFKDAHPRLEALLQGSKSVSPTTRNHSPSWDANELLEKFGAEIFEAVGASRWVYALKFPSDLFVELDPEYGECIAMEVQDAHRILLLATPSSPPALPPGLQESGVEFLLLHQVEEPALEQGVVRKWREDGIRIVLDASQMAFSEDWIESLLVCLRSVLALKGLKLELIRDDFFMQAELEIPREGALSEEGLQKLRQELEAFMRVRSGSLQVRRTGEVLARFVFRQPFYQRALPALVFRSGERFGAIALQGITSISRSGSEAFPFSSLVQIEDGALREEISICLASQEARGELAVEEIVGVETLDVYPLPPLPGSGHLGLYASWMRNGISVLVIPAQELLLHPKKPGESTLSLAAGLFLIRNEGEEEPLKYPIQELSQVKIAKDSESGLLVQIKTGMTETLECLRMEGGVF